MKNKLRYYRTLAGLMCKDICSYAGISYSTYFLYESGSRIPKVDTALNIVDRINQDLININNYGTISVKNIWGE